MFLVPRHGKSCHRRCAYGSRYPHTHVCTQYVFSFLLVYIAYRIGTQVFTHTRFTWFIVLGTVLFCCVLQLYIVHCSIKARKTKCTGALNMFFCLHFVCINVLPLKQNLLARPSFYKFLSFMPCIASPKQQKQNAPAH